MTLRIVQVMPFYSWRFGGSVEQARLVNRELARRGHAVTVLTTTLGDGGAPGWTEVDGCRVFRAAASGLARVPPYPPPRSLRRELDAAVGGAGVVTTQVGLTLLNLRALAACRRAGVPFVYSAQGALGAARLRDRRIAKALFLPCCERRVLRGAAALQALTAAEAGELAAQGAARERIRVIPNGIDPSGWGGGDRAAMRRAWGVPADATVVLFLGRLAPEKGLDLLLDATAPLLRERSGLRVVIAGPDGGEGSRVERRAAALGVGAQVAIRDAVPRAELRGAYAAADVFALTSRGEGLPLAVLEAAAAGRPLWLTTGCNVPEVATDGAGTVDPPDAAALRASLRALLDDADLRERCGAAARAMVERRFTLTATVDRLEALYRELAASAQRLPGQGSEITSSPPPG